MINSEQKKRITTNSITPTASGSILNLCQIAQGDDEDNRTGNRVLLHSIYFKAVATIHASATDTYVRVIFFVDKQNDGSAPTVADVLELASVLGFLNPDNTERFGIIKDDVYHLSQDQGKSGTYMKQYIDCNFHVDFDGTAEGDTNTNCVYMLVISTEATNTPTFTYNFFKKWYDN